MTGEEAADALERMLEAYALARQEQRYISAADRQVLIFRLVEEHARLILAHLRAGSDAAVYRAASAIEPMVGRPCTGALDIARAAIRAAVSL
jgi:hypothetical protein